MPDATASTGHPADVGQCCAGLRVVDASRVLAGPFCGGLLADLGADVIRVEHPTQLDEVRGWAPIVDGVSAAFAAMNHSKRSIALDLGRPTGAEVFRRLLADADVLIENYRPGTLDRFGFSRQVLRALSPRLVHCSVRAFPTGTDREKEPGYEASIQAFSGVMSLTGEADGNPVRCGPSVTDLGTGMASTIAILAALRERDRTGQGAYVEPALLRTATNLLTFQIAGWSLAGAVPQRRGSGHEALVPYGVFQAVDGPMLIAGGNDKLWAAACSVLGLGEAEGIPFPRLTQRVAHRAEVNAMVGVAVAHWPREMLIGRLTEAGVPATPVQTVPEYAAGPTLHEAGVLQRLPLPGSGDVVMAGPLFGGDRSAPPRRPPPRVGEHTAEILRSLGYDALASEALRAEGGVA